MPVLSEFLFLLPGSLPLTESIKSFHGRVHKTLAKQLAKALEPHKPLFIEEPLLPGQVPELNKLYGQTSIPIAVSFRSPTIR